MESFEDKIKLHNDLQKFQIEKSIVGSEAFYIEQDLMKGISQEEILEKARSGVYKPTKQNLKEGKAGQKYGSEKKEEQSAIDKLPSKNIDSFLRAYSYNVGKLPYSKLNREEKIKLIKDQYRKKLLEHKQSYLDSLNEQYKDLNKRYLSSKEGDDPERDKEMRKIIDIWRNEEAQDIDSIKNDYENWVKTKSDKVVERRYKK